MGYLRLVHHWLCFFLLHTNINSQCPGFPFLLCRCVGVARGFPWSQKQHRTRQLPRHLLTSKHSHSNTALTFHQQLILLAVRKSDHIWTCTNETIPNAAEATPQAANLRTSDPCLDGGGLQKSFRRKQAHHGMRASGGEAVVERLSKGGMPSL